jgi:hypothetical protein
VWALAKAGRACIRCHAGRADRQEEDVNQIGCIFTTYDNQGNLFVDGGYNTNAELGEFPKGGAPFVTIPLNQGWFWDSLQWDGAYLALDVPTGKPQGPSTIYRVAVSGSSATVVGKTLLYSRFRERNYQVDCQFWIQGNAILGGEKPEQDLAAWSYPAGGEPRKVFKPGKEVCGVTVSVAPSGNRIRR